VRLVLADDWVLLREALARVLEDAGFEIVGQAGDGTHLVRKVAAHRPDVAVIDVRMPPRGTDEGLRVATEIRARFPGTGVLLLSQYIAEEYAMELLGQGAEGVGYLLKQRISDVRSFADSVRRVGDGGVVLDPEILSGMLGARRRDDPIHALTDREQEVMALMAEGRSNQAIARALVVTRHAVEKHITNIFSRLELAHVPENHQRVLAVLAFLRRERDQRQRFSPRRASPEPRFT